MCEAGKIELRRLSFPKYTSLPSDHILTYIYVLKTVGGLPLYALCFMWIVLLQRIVFENTIDYLQNVQQAALTGVWVSDGTAALRGEEGVE